LGLQPSEMLEVVADRDVWRLNLELLPLQPSRKWAGSERRSFYPSQKGLLAWLFRLGTKPRHMHWCLLVL